MSANVAVNSADTISAVGGLAGLGSNGFILFAILVVAGMFLFAVAIAWKSIKALMNSHEDNRQEIQAVVARLNSVESRAEILARREAECIVKLDIATARLTDCLNKFKGE